ncbi:hypothetical protein IMSAGC013_01427 [Lachnospiraceae bacterium]|nr:hypothetical protein IMSAGC013_01427 [Lachnospiraceae bacterium]
MPFFSQCSMIKFPTASRPTMLISPILCPSRDRIVASLMASPPMVMEICCSGNDSTSNISRFTGCSGISTIAAPTQTASNFFSTIIPPFRHLRIKQFSPGPAVLQPVSLLFPPPETVCQYLPRLQSWQPGTIRYGY